MVFFSLPFPSQTVKLLMYLEKYMGLISKEWKKLEGPGIQEILNECLRGVLAHWDNCELVTPDFPSIPPLPWRIPGPTNNSHR